MAYRKTNENCAVQRESQAPHRFLNLRSNRLYNPHDMIDLKHAFVPEEDPSAYYAQSHSRSGFGRPNKGTSQQGSPVNSTPPVPQSPGPSSVMSFSSENDSQDSGSRKQPYFFREEYSNLIVKGNFMTLAAKPIHVEEGEWLAHQVVEQYRLLDGMIRIIKTTNEKTGQPICNPTSCPTMSAAGHTYTWLDQQKRPIKIPACQYILLVQKWIEGKFDDRTLFPIDNSLPPSSTNNTPGAKDWLGKASGFPENFETDLKSIYRQMMRCYSHIYHSHWLEPFWDLDGVKFLNTCFLHFINVGRTFTILSEREMEPMGPLIAVWEGKGLLPKKSDVEKTALSGSTPAFSGHAAAAAVGAAA